jgi:hypothetical protein
VQRSTLGVPLKITSSWRFAVMIWLIFSEGFAMSMMGRLRTLAIQPWSMALIRRSSRVFSV